MDTKFHKDRLHGVLTGGKMSSALKERLKRCGRSYTSPLSKTQPSHTVQGSPSACMKSEYKESSWSLKQNTNLDDSLAEHLPLSGEVGKDTPGKENTEMSNYDISSNFTYSTVTTHAPVGCTVTSGNSVGQPSTSQRTSSSLPSDSHEYPENFTTGVAQQKYGSLVGVNPDISNEQTNNGCQCLDTNIFSHLSEEKSRLQAAVRDKEEKLRKLHMVKTYRSKNELGQLQTLIDKWRSAAQEAVQELYSISMTADAQPTLTEFIDCLHLDHKLIGYSADKECFT